MATMNFSIPEAVKKAFNKTFKGHNKSAVITELMRKAIEDRRRRADNEAQLDALIEQVLRERDADEPVPTEQIRRAREAGRP